MIGNTIPNKLITHHKRNKQQNKIEKKNIKQLFYK